MSDKDVEKIIENEQEWRRFLVTEVKEIRKEHQALQQRINNLRTTVAMISGGIGTVSSLLISYIKSKLT